MRKLNSGKKIKEDDSNAMLAEYLKKRSELLGEFPKGYEVARLNWQLLPQDGSEHPSFGQLQTAGLGEAYQGDPGTSMT